MQRFVTTVFFFTLQALAVSDFAAPSPNTAGARLPIAKIGESIICCPGDSVVLDGWASIDIGGEVVAWLWDVNGDRKTDTVTDRGELVLCAPARSGSSTIHLQVRDNDGLLSRPDSSIVHVMASAPQVSMERDTVIKVGVRLSFEPHTTTNCGKMSRYEWDFTDDGRPEYVSEQSPRTSRVYFKPGKYTARFTVTDCFGHSAGGIQIINVR